MVVKRTKSAVFFRGMDQDTFLDTDPKEDWGGMLVVDNPDGVVQAYGIGPYAVGSDRGREYSQGAGTPKGSIGNASGMGKTMRVRGGSR